MKLFVRTSRHVRHEETAVAHPSRQAIISLENRVTAVNVEKLYRVSFTCVFTEKIAPPPPPRFRRIPNYRPLRIRAGRVYVRVINRSICTDGKKKKRKRITASLVPQESDNRSCRYTLVSLLAT